MAKVSEKKKDIAWEESERIFREYHDSQDEEKLKEDIYFAIIEALKSNKK